MLISYHVLEFRGINGRGLSFEVSTVQNKEQLRHQQLRKENEARSSKTLIRFDEK